MKNHHRLFIALAIAGSVFAATARATEDKYVNVREVEITADADGYGEVHVSARKSKGDEDHVASLEIRYGPTVIKVPAEILAKLDGLLLRSLVITTCRDTDGGPNKYWLTVDLSRYVKNADGTAHEETVRFPIRRNKLETPYRGWIEGNLYRTVEVK